VLAKLYVSWIWRDMSVKRMFLPSRGNIPWFAIALRAGHGLRLSPAFGGSYAGHTPPWPGRPSGITPPLGSEGVAAL
jgi:hypothetical protein